MKTAVDLAVESILPVYQTYAQYFRSIDPVTPHQVFDRYVFAYCTVNLGWQSSVNLYTRLQMLDWPAGEEAITEVFKEARSGFHNTRPKFMAKFAVDYFRGKNFTRYANPSSRDWPEFRRRLSKRVLGLGPVKLSFASELIHPFTSRIVCLDRHMISRLFAVDPQATHAFSVYEHYERLWLAACDRRKVAPALARLAYWDHMQGYDSPDFWAHVLQPGSRELFKQYQEVEDGTPVLEKIS